MTDIDSIATHIPLALRPGIWRIDPYHHHVGFTVRHLGVAKVRGRFERVEATLVVGDSLSDTSLTATIDVASLTTGNADRDAHSLAPDLLDVAKRPTLSFRSTAIRQADDGWDVDGELTLGDVTAPVTFGAEFGGIAEFPVDGSRHAGFEATTELRRADLGLDFGAIDALIGKNVKIDLDVELIEPA